MQSAVGQYAQRSAASPRFDTVDLLRGLSILAVLLAHASAFAYIATRTNPELLGVYPDFTLGAHLPGWLRAALFAQGSQGVSVFFAISGFLITYTTIARFGSLDRLRPSAFYRIRFARIAPPLALLLIVLSIFHFAHISQFDVTNGTWAGSLFAALTFQLNWYEAVHNGLNGPWSVLWSLSVEEVFYLVYPLLCLLTLRMRITRPLYLIVLCAVLAAGPYARSSLYTTNPLWSQKSYLGNMDNIALGCLFALLTRRLEGRPAVIKPWLPLASQLLGALMLLFVICRYLPAGAAVYRLHNLLDRSHTEVSVLGLGTCLIMFGSVLRRRLGWPVTAPVRWMGRLSYEIYLFHLPLVTTLMAVFLHHGARYQTAWLLAVVAACTLLGYAVSRCISEPLNRRLRGAPLPVELRPTA